MDEDPRYQYEFYIRASAEDVWAVLTDDEKTPLYQHFNMRSRTQWREGGRIEFLSGEMLMIEGRIIELQPPGRLSMSFSAKWSPGVDADPESRVTWEIVPLGAKACKLTLVHDGFGGMTETAKTVPGGWPEALSRLKTLVETGEPFLLDPSS